MVAFVPLGPAVQLTALLCVATLFVVAAWLSWSVRKHGWRKRSLRRFSYILFAILLVTRLAWCLVCLFTREPDGAHEEPPEPDEKTRMGGVLLDEGVLSSPTVLAIGRICFCVHFCVFSMLVCGWADSQMIMSGSSVQPITLRASTIFYYLGTPFLIVNATCTLVTLGTLVPPQLCVQGLPACDEALADIWRWRGVAAMTGFSVILALASVGAGAAVSCKIRDIASAEPALRPFAHAKLVKVALAATVFSSCTLSRAAVLTVQLSGRPVGLATFFSCSILLPELLPTIAALLVLRRRACPPWDCWRSASVAPAATASGLLHGSQRPLGGNIWSHMAAAAAAALAAAASAAAAVAATAAACMGVPAFRGSGAPAGVGPMGMGDSTPYRKL